VTGLVAGATADRSGVSVPVTPVCPAGRTRRTPRGWDGSRCQPARTSVGRGIESTGDQR
jgi:hypothetical protein